MFGKKTADDVLKLFAQLSDDEKAKVMASMKQPDTTDEKQIAKAEEDMDAKGEEDGTKDQSAKDVLDESVGEQERLDGNKDSQSAKDRIDESVGTEIADEKKADEEKAEEVKAPETDKYAEVTEALAARLSALEAKMSDFEQSLSDKVEKDHNQDFGAAPSVPHGGENNNRMADVMYNYAGTDAKKYY